MAMAHTPDTVKAQIQADIAASNAKTGAADTTLHDAVNRLIDGFGAGTGGITPTGKIKLTSNGTHNVTNYAEAEVAVPIPDGYIKPSGNLPITTNGTHDVTNFASVNVNIDIPNVKVYRNTLTSDLTSGWYTLVSNDAFLASLYNDPNAFILMYGKNTAKASTAMKDLWFCAGSTIGYAGATARDNILVRQSTSAIAVIAGTGLNANNYNGNLQLDSTGTLKTYGKTDYVMAAGEYVIIAGSV